MHDRHQRVPDRDALTLILTAEYSAPVEAVWQLWADPRQLERWWGPPTYPATVHEHDLRAGGRVTYAMTGPEGDTHAGWWSVIEVTPPTGLEFQDGFGDPDLPSEMPVTRTRATITATGAGQSRLVLLSSFPSREALEQLLAMGMQEGSARPWPRPTRCWPPAPHADRTAGARTGSRTRSTAPRGEEARARS